MNSAWQECVYNKDQLDEFFDIASLKKFAIETHLIDVNSRELTKQLLSQMSERIKMYNKMKGIQIEYPETIFKEFEEIL